MKLTTITILFLISLISGCQKESKYEAHLKTTDTLIRALYIGDTLKVGDLIGVNPERIGMDIEDFEFMVRGTTKLLQKYGMPKRTSYKVKEFSEEDANLIDVVVPIYKHGDLKREEGKIIVRFVKFLPSNRIAFFEVDGPFEGGNTIAP